MSALIFIAFLGLERKSSFLDRHLLDFLFTGLYFRCMQRFPAMGTELPAGFHNPVATRTVTFQAMAAFGTAQKRLLYITAAPGALFFPVVPST